MTSDMFSTTILFLIALYLGVAALRLLHSFGRDLDVLEKRIREREKEQNHG